MAPSNWKSRFTEEQLARKREKDRLSQQRAREQARKSRALLQNTLGHPPEAYTELREQNRKLRASLRKCRGRLEAILRCAQETLEDEDDDGGDDDEATDQSFTRSPSPINNHVTCSSIFHQIYPTLREIDAALDGYRCVTNIHQSLALWKMSRREAYLCQFVIEHSPLHHEDRIDDLETLRRRLSSASFYPRLLKGLSQREGTLLPEEDAVQDQLANIHIEKRVVAFCAYSALSPFMKLCHSKAEIVLMFWSQYTYFMFCAFPTEATYHSMPWWLRPTTRQFTEDHDLWLDYVCWPSVRETLLRNWRSYNLQKLARRLAQHVRFQLPSMPEGEALLTYDGCTNQLRLHPMVQLAMERLQNIMLTPEIRQTYPELTPTLAESTPAEISAFDSSISMDSAPLNNLCAWDDPALFQHDLLHDTGYSDSQTSHLSFCDSYCSGADVNTGLWYPYASETYDQNMVA